MQHHTVTLEGEIDLPGFRHEARVLLAKLVPPEDTRWQTRATAAGDLAVKRGGTAMAASRGAHTPTNLFLPRSFLSLCDTVILHKDPARFALLYRLLWRLVHQPDLRRNPLDGDRMRALHMAQAVRRDMQKMKSLIRFKAVVEAAGAEPMHIAWYEPDHHIVEAVAPFFAHRLAKLRWIILTPERSVYWDGEALAFGLGVRHGKTPPDEAIRDVWLTRFMSQLRSDKGSAPARSSRLDSAP